MGKKRRDYLWRGRDEGLLVKAKDKRGKDRYCMLKKKYSFVYGGRGRLERERCVCKVGGRGREGGRFTNREVKFFVGEGERERKRCLCGGMEGEWEGKFVCVRRKEGKALIGVESCVVGCMGES